MDCPFNPFSLSHKTILVTGASSGIGRSIAVCCAKMGANVIATGRDQARLDETVQTLPSAITAIRADLTNDEDIASLVSQIPKLDGLAQCAGVGNLTLSKDETKENIERVMNINFTAQVMLQSALLNQKKINKGASIVYISSRAAMAPKIGNSIYSATKGALLSFAKCLSLELAPRQIRVNSICPAMVWTDLIVEGGVTEEMLHEEEKKYPLKRYGTTEDVAYLCIYLLSDASKWMTGSTLDITGGAIGI